MRTRSTRVNDAFRNAFMVKVRKLFAEDEIFQQRRASQACFERILVVRDGHALVGSEHLAARIDAYPI